MSIFTICTSKGERRKFDAAIQRLNRKCAVWFRRSINLNAPVEEYDE